MDLKKSVESCGEEFSKNKNKQKKDDAMTKIMTPSKTMTDGQINKAVSNYRALLEKHAPEFSSGAVQTALGLPGLTDKMFAVFRQCIEEVSNIIIHRANVNRGLKPQEVLNTIGCKQYTDSLVVAGMPKGEGEETEVVFFKLGRFIRDVDLDKEYELRGLKPADPYSLAAVNEVDKAFADEHPNGTHWKDTDGEWCFMAFGLCCGERNVCVDRDKNAWSDKCWFGGLYKEVLDTHN